MAWGAKPDDFEPVLAGVSPMMMRLRHRWLATCTALLAPRQFAPSDSTKDDHACQVMVAVALVVGRRLTTARRATMLGREIPSPPCRFAPTPPFKNLSAAVRGLFVARPFALRRGASAYPTLVSVGGGPPFWGPLPASLARAYHHLALGSSAISAIASEDDQSSRALLIGLPARLAARIVAIARRTILREAHLARLVLPAFPAVLQLSVSHA